MTRKIKYNVRQFKNYEINLTSLVHSKQNTNWNWQIFEKVFVNFTLDGQIRQVIESLPKITHHPYMRKYEETRNFGFFPWPVNFPRMHISIRYVIFYHDVFKIGRHGQKCKEHLFKESNYYF